MMSLLAWMATGCISSAPPPDPLAPYRPAFDAEALPEDFDVESTPRYEIEMRIDPDQRIVNGVSRIRFRNLSGRPLNDIYVRLYPNLPQLLGGMKLTSVTTLPERFVVGYAYVVQNSAARITLLQPADPEAMVELEIAYEVNAPEKSGYVLFGESEGILSLPYSYPMLAAQTRDPTNPWRLDAPPPHGDIAITDSAFYMVTATVPSDVTVVSSGVTITTTQRGDGWADHVIVTGPVREFGLVVSRELEKKSADVDGARLNSYYLPQDANAGRAALKEAAGVLRTYNQLFTSYPFTELDIVEAPTRYLGMEYPGLNYIGLDTYREQRETQEILIAHEIAHQWWYELVGSDPYRYPWLDEGLAEHTSLLYFETIYGKDVADRIRTLRWQIPVKWAQENDYDAAPGQEVTAFSGANYEIIVYAKSAMFFDALYQELGREKYLQVLNAFIDRYRFKTPTPEDFLAIVEEVGGLDPTPLYETWILSPPPTP
ncbi:MAG: M1 family metallopeptidase [Chloroflexi bacterium]|nr:M1 family metallopeptidase [Chloroflexota bacterium]